jgi:hypothetical protein
MVSVTGKFKSVSDGVVGFVPDRNAPSSVPPTVMLSGFRQFPGVAPELVAPLGETVTVDYDTAAKHITFPVDRWLDGDLLNAYPEGTVTLALVQTVTRQSATVFIHPTMPIVMNREDFSSNAKDVVDRLLTDGDVIPVRIAHNAKGAVRLRAHDINDDETVLAAPELFPGRGPWLVAMSLTTVDEIRERYLAEKRQRDEFNDAMEKLAAQLDTDIHELREVLAGIGTGTGEIPVATTAAAPKSEKQKVADAVRDMATSHITKVLLAYKSQITTLITQNKALVADVEEKTENDRTLRAELSTARQRIQELDKQLGSARGGDSMPDRRHHFTTATEWIIEEVRRFWLDNYTPADRASFPLNVDQWRVLPSFATTFEALTDDGMDKAIKTATHIVTGRNAVEHIFEDHPLREGEETSRPEVVRDDGAASRRAYIESHTAQSRRLHYWRLRDGSIELSRVGLHDDFTP